MQTSPGSGQAVRLLSDAAAAKYLGVSRSSIYRLVHEGTLPYVQLTSHRKFDILDLNALILSKKMIK